MVETYVYLPTSQRFIYSWQIKWRSSDFGVSRGGNIRIRPIPYKKCEVWICEDSSFLFGLKSADQDRGILWGNLGSNDLGLAVQGDGQAGDIRNKGSDLEIVPIIRKENSGDNKEIALYCRGCCHTI